MRNWFSIQCTDGMNYIWVLYAGNNHEITRSCGAYTSAYKARMAAIRFKAIVSNSQVNYYVGNNKVKRDKERARKRFRFNPSVAENFGV